MLDTIKHPAIFLFIAIGAFGIRHRLYRSQSRWPERFIRAAVVGLIVVYVSLMLIYLAKPGYWDPIEPSITTVAQQLLQGRQIYHALDAAPRFSLLYGPSIFVGNALVLSVIDDPILASKLFGMICAVSALLAIYWALRREFERRYVFVGLGLFVVFALWYEHYTYWDRADSLLLVCASLGWLAVLSPRKWLRWLGLSLVMGVAINTKIHAPLFFLPPLVWLCLRRGYRDCVPPLVLAVIWIGLPFVFVPQLFSFFHYMTWLTKVGSLPLSAMLLGRNIEYGLLLAFWPVVLIGVVGVCIRPLRHLAQSVLPLVVTVLCILILVVIGAHPAAGPHHLIPLLPSIIYLTIGLFVRVRDQLRSTSAWSTVKPLFLAVFTPAWIVAAAATIAMGQVEIVFYDFVLPDEGLIQADLLKVKAAYADFSLQMGYGDIDMQRSTYFRPWLYTGQTEYFLDSMAMMDMQAIDVAIPPATLAVVTAQRFDIWLIPRTQRPFSMRNFEYVTREPLFGTALPEIFVANYTKVDSSQFYDIWKANRLNTK